MGDKLEIAIDTTTTIRASVKDVETTMVLSILLVVAVVFVFLSSPQATLIPGVAVVTSLVGTFAAMYLFGYSVNNLSLMALTVSTGFVVDDAIVVMEKITRLIEQGVPPWEASLKGAQEVSFTVLSMSLSLIDLPFDVSWEPDVWGRVRNTVREFAKAAQVSAADLANVRLTQQANLAEFYFELRGQDALIGLYQRTVAAYQENVKLTRIRSRTGVDNEQSVAEADLNLKSAIAAETNLRIARAQYEHAIALLTGHAASSFAMPVRPLITTVPAIPIGVPSQILQRRPDIAAAERMMSQANALIGVETAAY